MMKILYVTNMYPKHKDDYSGIFIKEQVDYLEQHFDIKPEVYLIDSTKKYWGNMEYLASVIKINIKLLFNRYDRIHVHYGLSSIFLFLNFWYPRKKLFLTLHGGDILKEQKKNVQIFLTTRLLKRFNTVIAINETIFGILTKKKAKTALVPCGINTVFFIPPAKESPIAAEMKIIFPSSPSRWEKNYPLFEEIIDIVENKYKIPVKKIMLDNCTRQQVKDLMQRADCLLLTSVSEGSPQVIKEALACNLPVVSVDVGDVRMAVGQLPACYVFRHEQKNELAEAISRIRSLNGRKPDLRSRIFELQIDQDSVCKKVFALYNN